MGPEKTQLPPAMGASHTHRPGMASEVGDTSLSEAVSVLRKRRWLLVLAIILGVAYGIYKAFTQPILYQASSTIQVHNGASNAYKLDSAFDYSDDSQTK